LLNSFIKSRFTRTTKSWCNFSEAL